MKNAMNVSTFLCDVDINGGDIWFRSELNFDKGFSISGFSGVITSSSFSMSRSARVVLVIWTCETR